MFCFVITNAQVNFSTPTNYSTYGSPTIIISEDFNGDGNKDLATANQYLGSISILINNGTGSFIVDSNYINSLRPNSLTCNDFNGDGNIDIITSNITDNSLSVYLGNGMGNFQNTNNIVITPIPNNGQSWSIVSADFNGDNNIDLAVGSTIPNSAFISILLGNGSGGFSPPLNINVGSFPYSITNLILDYSSSLYATSSDNIGIQYTTYLSGSNPDPTYYFEIVKSSSLETQVSLGIPYFSNTNFIPLNSSSLYNIRLYSGNNKQNNLYIYNSASILVLTSSWIGTSSYGITLNPTASNFYFVSASVNTICCSPFLTSITDDGSSLFFSYITGSCGTYSGSISIQSSPDQYTWTPIGTGSFISPFTASVSIPYGTPYYRLVAQCSGGISSDPSNTLYYGAEPPV